MTQTTHKIRRVAAALAIAAVCTGGAGCEQSQACDNISRVETPVTFDLACAVNDLTAVKVSGPCSLSNMSTDPADYTGNGELGPGKLSIGSQVAGLCHVTLTFASGFVYSTDVTFTGTSDDCGTGFITPTQSVFVVNDLSSTCTDGGSAAGDGGA